MLRRERQLTQLHLSSRTQFLTTWQLSVAAVSAAADPTEWRQAVRDRKIRLGDLQNRSAEELIDSTLAEYLDQLSKEALLKRLDILNTKCQPAPKWSFARQEYRFDRDRIEHLDQERQAVIHRVRIEQVRVGIEDDLTFLKATCSYWIFIVASRYALDVDPIRHAFSVLQGSTDDPVVLTHRSILLTYISGNRNRERGDCPGFLWTRVHIRRRQATPSTADLASGGRAECLSGRTLGRVRATSA